ncbi:MAG: hypothetical protein ABI867_25565 [Kofleriaceae bacterium]
MIRALIAFVLVAVGCGGEYRPARDTYNQGLAALAKGEHEQAEKLLIQARSEAGVDPELRFDAAYNLGVTFAAHADKVKAGKEEDLAKALELTQQAASWFSDASRLHKDDPATVTNLAIVRARVQSLTDELRKNESKLEARLDQIINEQRGVLDEARDAWFGVKKTGGSDPLAQQAPLTHLADRERGVVAEAGVISDLAVDEIDGIAKKPEDKRSDDEKVRMVQLKGVDVYLQEARSKIAEARRKLQELSAEPGVTAAEAALVALKRAREHLLDPITVLRGVAQDQLALIQDTIYGGAGAALTGKDTGPVPGWLAPGPLAERQAGLRDRVEEVKLQLTTALMAPPPTPDPNKPADPKQAKLLERVGAAMPSVNEASAEMDRANHALADAKLTEALERERAAIEALARAIEQFSDLKQTIELAYAEQQQITKLLAPETAKELDAAERGKQTRTGLGRNVDRMTRLKGLIADQLAEVVAQTPPPAPPAGSGSAAADPKAEQVEQLKQQLARAEELRGQAATVLAALGKALAATATDPMPHARDAEAKLEELRKLFFSVIEHLQQLIRDQGETRDRTSAISGSTEFERAPKLPLLIAREDEHAAIAKAITEALAAQADAAGKQQGPPQQGAPDAKTLAAAADEVRQAQSEIGDARGNLVKVRDATKSSETVKPTLEHQAKALEHLQKALELLQPPKQNKQQQDKQKQDPQPDKQDKQQPQGAGQRARDDDARQQKKRNEHGADDPVEKDW